MADVQHKRVAQKLKQACEETAAQAIAATMASGQASRIHGKNRKFGSRKEAMAAKARGGRESQLSFIVLTNVLVVNNVLQIAAAKAKREDKETTAT
jgi:hypothetical protein